MSLWLSARNPHNTESYHTEHPQTTSNGDPTETCRDAASHRNLPERCTPQKPARMPHPRKTCEDAAPHRNMRGRRTPQKPARMLVHWSRKNETLLSCGALRFWRISNKINPLNLIMIIFIIESNSASSLVRALAYDL